MSDAKRRGVRTILQMLLALLTGGGLYGVLKVFGLELDTDQYTILSGALLPVVTVVMNALEDKGTIPAVLKAPASDGVDPVPDVSTDLPEDGPDEIADLDAGMSAESYATTPSQVPLDLRRKRR